MKVGKNLVTPNTRANPDIFLGGGGGGEGPDENEHVLYYFLFFSFTFSTIYVKPLFLSYICCKKKQCSCRS